MPKPSNPDKQKYMFTDDIKFLQKAVVFEPGNKNQFLALKRAPDSFSRPNDWDLPGGNVLFGELHEASLRKEIKEESNLEVGALHPVEVVTNYNDKKAIYFIFIGFYCRAQAKNVKTSQEHTEHRWVSREEFIELRPAQYLLDLVEAVFCEQ